MIKYPEISKTMHIAIKASIAHWKRMIAWAEKQEPNYVDPAVMFEKIGEIWTDDYCSLCMHYGDITCKPCPLYKLNLACGSNSGSWQKVAVAKFWECWTYQAKNEMLPALYSCFELCL